MDLRLPICRKCGHRCWLVERAAKIGRQNLPHERELGIMQRHILGTVDAFKCALADMALERELTGEQTEI